MNALIKSNKIDYSVKIPKKDKSSGGKIGSTSIFKPYSKGSYNNMSNNTSYTTYLHLAVKCSDKF